MDKIPYEVTMTDQLLVVLTAVAGGLTLLLDFSTPHNPKQVFILLGITLVLGFGTIIKMLVCAYVRHKKRNNKK